MKYRPWGPVEWVLSLSSQKAWRFIGAIGTEERSLTSLEYMKELGAIESVLFAEILDVDSEKYWERTRVALQERRTRFTNLGGKESEIQSIQLMAELYLINAFAVEAESSATSIILDISSFPKRYFFPILRKLVNSEQVKNLLVTYTSPESYAPEEEPLFEDIEKEVSYLPGFRGDPQTELLWVISVGFMVESLRKHIDDNQNNKMKLLIPFPAPLSSLRRTWESVVKLEESQSKQRFEKIRVETLDMSSAFNRIQQIAGHPRKHLAFAPFGPKPTSAAMCLYAMQNNSPVLYPQPTIYHPDYSLGIRNNKPSEAVRAYWVKHEGENLYSN